MLVQFWSGFSKRENSTKLPKAEDATIVSNVQLKDECSFMNPVLRIDGNNLVSGAAFSPSIYNYCYINYWERFYFIRDWRWVNGLWECDLSVDVLASFRSQIGDTDAYVIRAAADYDGSFMDAMYPISSRVNITNVSVTGSWYGTAPSGGCYVVGILNYQNSNKVGAVSYYALTSAQFGSLMAYLMSDQIFNTSDIDEIGEGLYKSFFDPCQYIVSCIWFPFNADFGTTTTTIKVGYWDTGVTGTIMSQLARKIYISANIPNHPQISRGEYLNREPFTRITLYLAPFGAIPIDTDFLSLGNYLYSAVLIDHVTGQATIRLAISKTNALNEYNIFTERSGMVGVPIQISQILQDYVGMVSNASDGNILSNIGNAIVAAAGGVLNHFIGSDKKTSTVGANGSFIQCLLQPVLSVEHYYIADENNTEFGRPLCKTYRINQLSGYIMCGEDDHDFSGTEEERIKINHYLKNGFFYE